jgi:hypothetical protein
MFTHYCRRLAYLFVVFAASLSPGARLAPPDSTQVPYISSERDEAVPEIAFRLSQLTPRPSKPIAVDRLHATARAAIRPLRSDLCDSK